jgi:hypothetical protein
MTKYKHKTEHSLFPVGLKGTHEDDFRKNIACFWKVCTLKDCEGVGVEFCDYRKM